MGVGFQSRRTEEKVGGENASVVGGPQRVVGVRRRHRLPSLVPPGVAGGVRLQCDRSGRPEDWQEKTHYPSSGRECHPVPENFAAAAKSIHSTSAWISIATSVTLCCG